MADQVAETIPVDPYKALNVSLNPDGTLTRGRHPLMPPPPPEDPTSTSPMNIPLNPTNNTYLRVYQPPVLPPTTKLPLIIYFHGGGFIMFDASGQPYNEFCVQVASELPAVILSVGYRLAPENRLPSAYEDAMEAILWVKNHALKSVYKFFDLVDFSKCFLMGSSSGGNIAYHVGVQALGMDLDPFKINGLIMIQPFFGGVKRSGSELRLANDMVLPLPVTDLMWELALPVGADRDHEYANPMTFEKGSRGFPRCYIRGHVGDPLIDRQLMFGKLLEEHGVCVVEDFTEDGFHGCESFVPEKAKELIARVNDFIHSSSAAS